MNIIPHLPSSAVSSALFLATYCISRHVGRVRPLSILRPPRGKKAPTETYFGINPMKLNELRGNSPMNPPRKRVDDYSWMRDDTRENEVVLNHLKAENSYCDSEMKRLEPLQTSLYTEMISYLKETDEEVPFPFGNFEYYSRTVQGKPYKIHCRRPKYQTIEQIVLDENEIARDHEYCDVSAHDMSPDHSLVAYSVDHSGYETYTVRIKCVDSGELREDVVEDCTGDVEWGIDSSSFYYLTMDSEHRPNKVWLHVLGTPQAQDCCLFSEDNPLYWMGIEKSASERYLVISNDSTESSEKYVLDLRQAQQVLLPGSGMLVDSISLMLKCVAKRSFGVRYSVEHHGDKLYICTNKDGCIKQRLVTMDLASLGSEHSEWTDVIPYDKTMQIDDVLAFEQHLAVIGRKDGLPSIWIVAAAAVTQWKQITFPENSYSVDIAQNAEYCSTKLRLEYSSLLTPKQIIDYDMVTATFTVLKQQEVPGYDPCKYSSARIFGTASDGTKIPMSAVFSKTAGCGESVLYPRQSSPVLLYGYGSYGICVDPSFDFKRLTLLDRGVVFVIAHIRGGGEMGRQWYEEQGKYLTKRNTFSDFADCAKSLIESGVTSADKLAVVGRSAGGLLIGGVCNMYPALFKAAVADVPFVDVMNTMSDPTIPLTVAEWEEWGNPNEAQFHDYMLSYSPYDNVSAQAYPAMLVTAGLNDPRVAYWEPAKWVAKLRDLKTDTNPLLLKTDLSSGHFSASDRYKYIHQTAFEYSFILDQICAKCK